MASLDMSSFASGLKSIYTDEKIQNMVYQDNPWLAMIPKKENFNGKNLVIPVIYGNPQGRSATFTDAKSNKTASKIKDFTITRNKDYSLASIDSETMDASVGNSGAFMEAVTLELDGAINSASRSLAIALYGSGSGRIGKISAINGLVLTLTQAEDITNFEVDMTLNASTADGGGTLKVASPTVTAVDRNNGLVTVSSVTNLAVNDFLFVEGDYDLKIKGLQAWLPATVTNTPFFGMDRSVDPSRLAGQKIDGSAKPVEEALIDCASRIAREGGKPTHVFISYGKYAELEKSLGKHLTH